MAFSFVLLVALFLAGAADEPAAVAVDAPPEVKEVSVRKPPSCECAAEAEAGAIILEGVVVDAELRLGPDGLSASDRQVTIFDVSPKIGGAYSGRTRIWHSTDPALCGVAFEYGRKYELAARKTEEGELETDACLMRAAGGR